MAISTPLQITGTVPVSPISSGALPITTEWRAFFTTLLTRTGGTVGTDVNNVQIKSTQITDSGATGRAVLQSATPEAARTAIGAGTSDLTLAQVGTSFAGHTITFNYDSSSQQIDADLKTTGVHAGTYGGSGQDLQISVDAYGRVTSALASPAVPDIATLWTLCA